MSDASARAAAYDAAVRAETGPDADRARRKLESAVDYAQRELASSLDALERVRGKAAKFEAAARQVREVELPEAAAAVEAADVRLAEALRAVED